MGQKGEEIDFKKRSSQSVAFISSDTEKETDSRRSKLKRNVLLLLLTLLILSIITAGAYYYYTTKFPCNESNKGRILSSRKYPSLIWRCDQKHCYCATQTTEIACPNVRRDNRYHKQTRIFYRPELLTIQPRVSSTEDVGQCNNHTSLMYTECQRKRSLAIRDGLRVLNRFGELRGSTDEILNQLDPTDIVTLPKVLSVSCSSDGTYAVKQPGRYIGDEFCANRDTGDRDERYILSKRDQKCYFRGAVNPCDEYLHEHYVPVGDGEFDPECDYDGFYKPLQCDDVECWCVDREGIKIANPSGRAGSGPNYDLQCNDV